MWNRSNLKGFTLIEALVSLVALGLLTLGLGALFIFSLNGFKQAGARQGTQAQILSVRVSLANDLPLSNFRGAVVQERTKAVAGENVRRDGLSIVSMSDWDDVSLYDAAGLPRWDRHVVYYATLEDSGRLIRQLYQNTAIAPAPVPFLGLSSRLSDNPASNADSLRFRVVASGVHSWECEADVQKQAIVQTLKIRKTSGRSGLGAKSIDEVQEALFNWELVNTTPKL